MKVWLDDVRPAPKGYIHAKTADDAIYLFNHFEIEFISLDHDLGDNSVPERDGMTVLDHIERVCFTNPRYPIPDMIVHSANPVAKKDMNTVIRKIKEMKR